MTKETLVIKDAVIARLIAAKLAAIKAAGGDVASRRICVDQPSLRILTATEE